MKFKGIMTLLFFAGALLFTACGGGDKDEKDKKSDSKEWPAQLQESFMNSCLDGVKDTPEINGDDYCNCVLQKIMVDYPNPVDATKAMGKIMDYATDCI